MNNILLSRFQRLEKLSLTVLYAVLFSRAGWDIAIHVHGTDLEHPPGHGTSIWHPSSIHPPKLAGAGNVMWGFPPYPSPAPAQPAYASSPYRTRLDSTPSRIAELQQLKTPSRLGSCWVIIYPTTTSPGLASPRLFYLLHNSTSSFLHALDLKLRISPSLPLSCTVQ